LSFLYVNYIVRDSYSSEQECGLIHYDNNINVEKNTEEIIKHYFNF